MSVQRWTDYGDDILDDHPEGEFVLYADHAAEVERVKWMTFGMRIHPQLTADDPEPAIGSIVRIGEGTAVDRTIDGWGYSGSPREAHILSWAEVNRHGPVLLLWDGANDG